MSSTWAIAPEAWSASMVNTPSLPSRTTAMRALARCRDIAYTFQPAGRVWPGAAPEKDNVTTFPDAIAGAACTSRHTSDRSPAIAPTRIAAGDRLAANAPRMPASKLPLIDTGNLR